MSFQTTSTQPLQKSLWHSLAAVCAMGLFLGAGLLFCTTAFASLDGANSSAFNGPRPQPDGLLSHCGTGLLRALQTGSDISKLLQLSPSALPSENSNPNDSVSDQPWVQQLIKFLQPLRAGGALVELLQSPFFHYALRDQAVEAGWNGSERFSRFFSRLQGKEQVQFLRALTVRLWLYSHRDTQRWQASDVFPMELVRYRELLWAFMKDGSDEIVQHFLARIQHAANKTDADVHRISVAPEVHYAPDAPSILAPSRSQQTALALLAAGTIDAPALDPHYAFLYWLQTVQGSLSAQKEQALIQMLQSQGALGELTLPLLASYRLPQVDERYLASLSETALVLQIQNLEWRLAMSRITNPHEVVENLRRHVQETIQASRSADNTASWLLAALSNFVLKNIGLGWLGFSVQPENVSQYSAAAFGWLPKEMQDATQNLFAALNSLEQQLNDWVRQAAAIGEPGELQAELTRLREKLPSAR